MSFIIALCVVQGDAFGCPYVTLAPAELAEQLHALRLPAETVQDAVAKARGKHYQLACMAAFEGQHTCICDSGINHPNQVCSMHIFFTKGKDFTKMKKTRYLAHKRLHLPVIQPSGIDKMLYCSPHLHVQTRSNVLAILPQTKGIRWASFYSKTRQYMGIL